MKMKTLVVLAVFLAARDKVFSHDTPQVEFKDSSSTTEVIPGTNDVGRFTIRFEITADDEDIYIFEDTIFSPHKPKPGSGFNWYLTDASTGIASATAATVTSGSHHETPESFRIEEGETKTFQFVAIVNPETTGFYGVSLNYLEWSLSSSGPHKFLALDGFDTSEVLLNVVPEPSTSDLALAGLGIGLGFLLLSKREKPHHS